ncbi:twin-arginine translocase TatA/TatE family subunit [Sphingomonas cavernae]|uniref:Sec-independent protein translocase protein TatA n=1 Tax=Sphingomonas cavernae TaxID=2320861 RepID=A0A418WKL5_9SPHN|nr:twin-arginine translocase TatA/TatE family subunit [Sphingomonas cavernae]RJF90545.1 twin-arginine translocase TatA/TatE family subunit [Sphingomonas cavernae]
MGGLSLWHWLVVGVVILLLFGKGRFSDMMGDVAKGIKSFKKGMSEDEEAPKPVATPRIETQKTVEPTVEHEARPVSEDRPAN